MIPEVWVFFPRRRGTGDVDRVRRLVRGLCVERGWPLQERPVVPEGPAMLLTADDAQALYRRMHRGRVAVLSLQLPREPGPRVLRRPRLRGALGFQATVSLRHLCRHKAFFLRLRVDRAASAWPSAFMAWCARVECEGQHDPRCLPLHVFSAKGWSRPLATSTGRGAFSDRFGAGASRVDERSLRWETGPMHGTETLGVAGYELPAGFHWDVSPEGAAPVELWTPQEGWLVRTYANVAPDANVRAREPHAKRITRR